MRILREPEVKEPVGGTYEQKIEMPSPPPEHIAKMTFGGDVDEVIKEIGGVQQLPPKQEEKKPEEKKPEEKKVEQPKKEEKVEKKEEKKEPEVKQEDKKEEEKKPESKLPKYLKPPKSQQEQEKTGEHTSLGVKAPTKETRDTSWMSPQEAVVAKQMSNEAFEIYSKALKENKELVKSRDGLYLQHEEAYLLDPQFRQYQSAANMAQREAQYWQEQLLKIDKGEKWKPITGYDEKGNWIYGTEQEASKMAEEQIRLQMTNTHGVLNQIHGALQQYPQRFKGTVQSDLAAIQNYRSQQFAWVNDPKLMDYTIPIDGLGERSLKQIKEDVSSLWPIYMRNHPAVQVVSDLVIALRFAQAELAEMRNGKEVEKVIQEEEHKVEPSSGVRPREEKAASNKYGGPKEFSLADMPV